MIQLSDEFAINFVKELTITAMSNKLISKEGTPSDTASAVYDFYKTLYDSFTSSENN